jgi:hypothetical protein
VVNAKIREILSVGKQAARNYGMEKFNLKNLNDLKVKEQYQVMQ